MVRSAVEKTQGTRGERKGPGSDVPFNGTCPMTHPSPRIHCLHYHFFIVTKAEKQAFNP